MGFFDSIFGGSKPQYPQLEPSTTGASEFERYKSQVESFAGRVKDNLEVVAGPKTAYVFIGKPPKTFGMVWFSGGEEHNFKTLMAAKKLSQVDIQLLSDRLREAYVKGDGAPRYSATVAGRSITVTVSDAFAAELERVVKEAGG